MDWNEFFDVYDMACEYLNAEQMFAIDIHTEICGNTVDNFDDCIYVFFGYRTFRQYYESELKCLN